MKQRIKKIFSNSGLSIIEVIISITIIIVGISSVMLLFENNFRQQELNMRKLVAYNLAKEGIEIARWQRDSYWFSDYSSAFEIGWGNHGAEEVIPVLYDDGDPLKGWRLRKEGNGANKGKPEVYLYYDNSSNKIMYIQSDKRPSDAPASWIKTEYKRILFINQDNPDGNNDTDNDMQIVSRVEYAPGKAVELEAYLYNWN